MYSVHVYTFAENVNNNSAITNQITSSFYCQTTGSQPLHVQCIIYHVLKIKLNYTISSYSSCYYLYTVDPSIPSLWIAAPHYCSQKLRHTWID